VTVLKLAVRTRKHVFRGELGLLHGLHGGDPLQEETLGSDTEACEETPLHLHRTRVHLHHLLQAPEGQRGQERDRDNQEPAAGRAPQRAGHDR
jgi:hypothetical protein